MIVEAVHFRPLFRNFKKELSADKNVGNDVAVLYKPLFFGFYCSCSLQKLQKRTMTAVI